MHLRARLRDKERKKERKLESGTWIGKGREAEREREQSVHKGGLEPVNHGSMV